MDVASWLAALGLERYEPAFCENGIDAELLPKPTPKDLQDLGVSRVGDRRRLLDAISALRDVGGLFPAPLGINPRVASATSPARGEVESGSVAGSSSLAPACVIQQRLLRAIPISRSSGCSVQPSTRNGQQGAKRQPWSLLNGSGGALDRAEFFSSRGLTVEARHGIDERAVVMSGNGTSQRANGSAHCPDRGTILREARETKHAVAGLTEKFFRRPRSSALPDRCFARNAKNEASFYLVFMQSWPPA